MENVFTNVYNIDSRSRCRRRSRARTVSDVETFSPIWNESDRSTRAGTDLETQEGQRPQKDQQSRFGCGLGQQVTRRKISAH